MYKYVTKNKYTKPTDYTYMCMPTANRCYYYIYTK